MFVIVFSSNLKSLSIIIMQALILLIVCRSIFMFKFKLLTVTLKYLLLTSILSLSRSEKSKSGRRGRMSPYLFKNIKVRITFRARPQRNWRIQRCPHQHRYLAGWRRCVDFINSVTLQRTTALG